MSMTDARSMEPNRVVLSAPVILTVVARMALLVVCAASEQSTSLVADEMARTHRSIATGIIEAKRNGTAHAISDVVLVEDDVAIKGYVIDRTVYRIVLGKEPSFEIVTHSLDVSEHTQGFYGPPRAVKKGTPLVLDSWMLALPAVQDAIFLVTSSATITLSNGEKAVCDFRPIIIVRGAVVTADSDEAFTDVEAEE